jgi:hypothetical protein
MNTITAKEALQNSELANLTAIFKHIEKVSKRGEKYISLYFIKSVVYSRGKYCHAHFDYRADDICLSKEEVKLLETLGYKIVKKPAMTLEEIDHAAMATVKDKNQKTLFSRKPKYPEAQEAYDKLCAGFPHVTEIHWD